ncbi:alanine--tRNA ligase [Weeksella virosa]|mgnify:CR=1 FL=1|uniref:Alanine--tRNA ligase n=1 Tax=Weeksella virosa (strain ATCC 43766 / DSM 16922 / JCM 21250 / CCUG 30538 / CDC 9751 / IAM 14551 / NBRC 16016 / NCTC 11634 / CL345/78) TaxID=865938 RepID=F0NXW4_WEEVC|nr:alanine--tRNA ligase [Weeksella virosa]ADX68032.1 alanyl-tRNA synthetase [Weeksella virosa DSM 16922]SUP54340.1 Alanine--tRNA ligase [Weeksella virosa]VEH64335.1 Alanine--tRNA ligase [Weeksella virosa]
MKSKDIRKEFLNFFQQRNHLIVDSAPIVLKDDPTLMFNNSGMAQFKEYFLGNATPKSNRIADTQKCLRVSGKHNDLDDVGKDTYHHTMFEMLGNWSFGDYFKKEAIAWAWELLTGTYGIGKDQIYVTVFEGDEKDGTQLDQEALDLWKEHIAEDRILLGNKKDNFWEMGDVGPCGPCSEIHVDIRPEEERLAVDGKSLVNQDHPQVIEIWNLVFMQYQRRADGSLEPLPAKHIDTGMGFERLAMVLQGKTSNYDTDVFRPLIKKLEKISGITYGDNEITDIAIRVVVDHLRAVSFAIADGQLPSNTGAGYVIRRILRRAISYGYRFLNLKEPFIYLLFPILKDEMGDFFPELIKQESIVTGVIREEESSFLRTIEHGLNRLNQIIDQYQDTKVVPGHVVFELYDTYGFPADLSRIVVEDHNFTIDEDGFEVEMSKQKARSKKATALETDDWVIVRENANEEFVGYDILSTEVQITRYRKVKNKKGEFYQLVLDKTPFYAESGGQIGDTGLLISANEQIEVLNTKKENNLIIHFVEQLPSNIEATFQAEVDSITRNETQKNHSATHLLHEALRTVLGTHVEQKGSYVGPDYLRFDFSHFGKMTTEEIAEVEKIVNDRIVASIPLDEKRNIPFDEAVSQGAMALFGEKYGDYVRLIKFGSSVELCGGTHVKNTSDIRLFKITSESSTAAGIRRIEAITSNAAIDVLKEAEKNYQSVLDTLKTKSDAKKAVQQLLDENAQLKKQVEKFVAQQAKAEKENWKQQVKNINGIQFLAIKTDLNTQSAKQNAIDLTNELDNAFVVVATKDAVKPSITISIAKNLVEEKQLNAGQIVREIAKNIQGSGGGQAFLATAGGKDVTGIDKALAQAETFVQ